jgi:hypothetical protein
MALEITNSVNIKETMDNYIAKIRPEPEIRNKLDLNYEIKDQSVILNEIRPSWNNPKEIMTIAYAKATFVKNKNVWKIFWKRTDNKWHTYMPQPEVGELKDFLKLVDEDKYFCFNG